MTLRRIAGLFSYALVVALLLFPSVSQAVDYGGLGGRPAHPDPQDPRTSNWFVYTLDPGTTRNDEIMIINNTGQTKTVELYPADSTPSSEGGFALKQKVESMTEVGSWIHISDVGPFTLANNEIKTIPFSITIPANPEPGEHTGGILVQEVKPASADQGGIALSLRMGVRVYVTIPGDITKRLTLLPLQTTTTMDDVLIHVPVRNEGNVSRDGKLNINIYSVLTGKKVANFSDINIQVLRDSTLVWHAKWPRSWHGGLYRIEANVVYDSQNGPTTIFSDSITLFVWPSLLTLSIIGLLLTLLILILILRRPRKKEKIIKKTKKKSVRKASSKKKA